MIYLAVDTNQWIYTAVGRFSGIVSELENRVESGNLVVFTNDLVIAEWRRNKGKTTANVIQSIKSEAISAMKLTDYISDEGHSKALKQIISTYQKDEQKRKEEAIYMVEKVEMFLTNKCRRLHLLDKEKMQAVELALAKTAPMHRNKNSIADAIIFLNFINEMQRIENDSLKPYSEFIFISNNSSEFSCLENKQLLHPDLEKLFDFDLKYFLTLPAGLNLADDLIQSYYYYFEELSERLADGSELVY